MLTRAMRAISFPLQAPLQMVQLPSQLPFESLSLPLPSIRVHYILLRVLYASGFSWRYSLSANPRLRPANGGAQPIEVQWAHEGQNSKIRPRVERSTHARAVRGLPHERNGASFYRRVLQDKRPGHIQMRSVWE